MYETPSKGKDHNKYARNFGECGDIYANYLVERQSKRKKQLPRAPE
jgi:hypothetical protein